MAKDVLPIEAFPNFLETLALFGELHGPVLSDDGVLVFGRIACAAEVLLDYRRTLLPPKKYLLPPRETILTYTPGTGYRHPAPGGKETVLFGLHPCDLAGIVYLDKVFLGAEPDPLYRKRREGITLVGLSCEPDDVCFCGDVGAAEPAQFDLFLERTTAGFRVASGSARGEKIRCQIAPLLVEGEEPSPPRKASAVESAVHAATRRGETFLDSPLWDDFAARCLSCGACSLCCPTCYCFDVREQGGLDVTSACRQREWDNCLFKEHGEVAGGFNFRKERRERFHYRYRHKYLGFGPTRGIVACVGCGRCREVCPVRIDLLELFGEET